MARSWLIDSRGLASKVKNASLPATKQIRDCGANRECPNCHYLIDNSDISHEWPGLPVGVKFDPSDVELLDHLAAKSGVGNSEPHKLIDEFIPTLDGDEGICYTHPENLPGAKKDGSSIHFFCRTMNAYATGKRKRRKIQTQSSLTKEQVRWHKTGKTKPLMENGMQKGYKKIMVLYGASSRGSKPDKCNWVMYQYHLGTNEDERNGEYVVAKIFYQQKKQGGDDAVIKIEESDIISLRTSPRTPKIVAPNPPRAARGGLGGSLINGETPSCSLIAGETPSCDDVADDSLINSPIQEVEFVKEKGPHPSSTCDSQLQDELEYKTWLAGESQVEEDMNSMDKLLQCDEIMDSSTLSSDFLLRSGPSNPISRNNVNDVVPQGNNNSSSGIAELENLELDTPPDFQFSDFMFGSQDSIFGWLDQL